MLKKTLAIILTITALLSLSSCSLFPPVETEEVVTFDVSAFTKVESEVDTTVDTTEVTTEVESPSESQDVYTSTQFSSEIRTDSASSATTTEAQSSLNDDITEEMVIPAPIVAKWGTKTVTMEFKCVTNILYDGYFGCSHFQNGYAQFNDIGDVDCPIDISEYNGVNFNYMDYEGNRLFDHGFESTSSFDENGLAVAKKHDGTYVLISNDGSEKSIITKDEYDAFCAKLRPWSTPHYAKYYGDDSAYENYGIIRRGNLYEGLIPVLKRSDPQRYDTYLGLVDLNGNIVIEPTFGIYYCNRPIYLTEGYIAVIYQNRVSVIKVTIEGEDDNADTLYPDEVVLPEPIITQWEDKTITIEYETVTDIILPYDTPTYYVNGYARIFECGNVDSPIDGKDVGYGTYYNYIDSKGNRLFEYGFKKATHFDENGIAYAQMLDGTYVCIGNDGTVRETVSPERFYNFKKSMESYIPSIVSSEYESKLKKSMPEGMRVMHCGNEQDGLIPIIISVQVPDEIYGTDVVRKLGFADTEGNIIVQPDTIKAFGVLNGTFWNEGKMIIDYNNRLAILNVTVLPQYSNINNLSQNYFEVIKNEKPFLLMDEEMLIDNYKSPYLQKYLIQCDDVQYAVLDMDGDGENEVLISGWTGDILVLHEENGNIYGFDFTFREMYNVKTDGSYYWNTNQGNTYGCSKLSFENGTCSSIELCRTELSDDGIATFFVKDVSVAKEEYDSLTESLSGADSLTWYKLNIFPKQIADEG